MNLDAIDEKGIPGRGIQYPFAKPTTDTYHSPWRIEDLEPWKEVMRNLLVYHANQADSNLGQVSTEFIPNFDYGEGCNYSLFEQAIACVEWMRNEWTIALRDAGCATN